MAPDPRVAVAPLHRPGGRSLKPPASSFPPQSPGTRRVPPSAALPSRCRSGSRPARLEEGGRACRRFIEGRPVQRAVRRRTYSGSRVGATCLEFTLERARRNKLKLGLCTVVAPECEPL